MFKIHKKFNSTTHYIGELKLCTLRLQDNHNFPWIILIPKRKGITQILDLNKKDQTQLLEEIQHCSKVMKKYFNGYNLNVEKVGNIIPQLHIHVIARNKKDISWPLSVWVVKPKPYSKSKLNPVLEKLKKYLLC